MLAVAENMAKQLPDVEFIPLVGGQAGVGLAIHANAIAALMARRTGGSAKAVFAPAVAESREARESLVKSAPVAPVLAAAAAADVCVFSLGAPFAPNSTLTQIGYYSQTDVDSLRRAGAACDLVSISFYDSDCVPCSEEVSAKTVSITGDQLRSIPLKVCVAGGADKREAIRIALLLGNVIDVMVVDDRTAAYLAA
jgi:DNA-binding transcriptional regulator LsrR (DeoR family)